MFIETFGDVENYRRIEKEVKKAKLEVTEDILRADCFLFFRSGSREQVNGAIVNSSAVMIAREQVATGVGQVWMPNKQNKEKPRLIMEVSSARDKYFEKRPAVKFAKAFVKEWQAVNK